MMKGYVMHNHCLALSIVDKIVGNAPYMCQGDFPDRIRYAAALGYSGVELNIADPEQMVIPAIDQALHQTGMRITAFGTGRAYVNDGLSLTDAEPACREAAMRRLRSFLDLAGRFDALVIIGCIRGNLRSPQDSRRSLEMLAEALMQLENAASDRKTALVLEPINRYENNFLCNVGDTANFIRDSGLKRTQILADTFHMNIEDPPAADVFRKYADSIAYVHIADSNRFPPGCGHTDFSAIFEALAKKNYTGSFCAECRAEGDMDEGCALWLNRVQALLAKQGNYKL